MSGTTEFSGLRAVVTGGSSGIGLATVQLLAAAGAEVVSLDVSPLGADEPGSFQQVDITDEQAVIAAIDQVVARIGGLDILVNNAGISAVGTIEANPMAEWRRVFDVNVFGLVHTSRAALPHLRASANAAIVNVASIAATTGLPTRAVYGATKGAVQALSLAMAADLVSERIRVNVVNPGTADTPFVVGLLARAADPVAERVAMEARQPIGRLIRPAEVARAIAYLAGPLSGSTTGTVLTVDGGFTGFRLAPARTAAAGPPTGPPTAPPTGSAGRVDRGD